jgi:hypothetical protein
MLLQQHDTSKKRAPLLGANKQVQLPQKEVKYLGLHLDRRLAWHKQIFVNGNN